MLKVEMIIENLIASSDTPEQFIRQKVLKEATYYSLIDIKVVQDNNLKLISDNSKYTDTDTMYHAL